MTLKTVDRNCLSFEEKDETFVKHIYDKLTYCNFNFLQKFKPATLTRFLSINEIQDLKKYHNPTLVLRGYHLFKSLDFLYCKYCKSALSVVTAQRAVQSNEFKQCPCCQPQKVKETCLDKYGVDNFSKTAQWEDKVRQTCAEKYGKDWVTKLPETQFKIQRTCLEQYGVTNVAKSNVVKSKMKNTNFKRYGSNSPMTSKDVVDKIRKTNIQKYGHPRGPNSSSKLQKEVTEYIQKFISVETDYNLNGKDLDIYIPELKLGIEVNGDYWHSTQKSDKNNQLIKTNLCESKGIRLIHIWESEWRRDKEFIKGLLNLYLNNKVHQNEFQKLLEQFENRLPRDYFSILDFPGKIEEPVLEKSGKFDVYKTGYILI